jgi:hypothetical protein
VGERHESEEDDGHYDTSVGVVGLVAIGPGAERARKGG